MDEGFAIILAAVMATLGIMYASRQQRKLLRRQHTYQAIERHNRWQEFDECLDRVKAMTDSGNIPEPDDDARIKDYQAIDFILNYYEFLSAAIWCGDIDEALVYECENFRLRRSVNKLESYIRANHISLNDKTVWENLLLLEARWRIHPPRHGDYFVRAVEGIWGKPIRQGCYRGFWTHAYQNPHHSI